MVSQASRINSQGYHSVILIFFRESMGPFKLEIEPFLLRVRSHYDPFLYGKHNNLQNIKGKIKAEQNKNLCGTKGITFITINLS